MEPDDIDLYADVESEFPSSSSLDGGGESGAGGDLYDDVLTSKEEESPSLKSVKDEGVSGPLLLGKSSSSSSAGSASVPGRKYQVYVGNLTWWTTDADVSEAVGSIVQDFLEVKFYENRANGQSKGFCAVSLGSEASARTLLEKLPKKELHGQSPVVTYATKQALHQFEAQSKTRPTPQASSGNGSMPPKPPMPPQPGNGPRLLMRNVRPPFPALYQRPPPPTPNRLGPPPNLRAPPPPAAATPLMVGLPPPRGPPPPIPAPHVNPAFFPPPPPHHGSGGSGGGSSSSYPLSEMEFEEIMSRNRTVSSSAIARAVQDAANTEYASAIETLVTAISLIKQSKVASDDRCKILISSLQDTLHGIENKSYGARRERSRSRERHHHHHHNRHNHRRRSYSRERGGDYRADYYKERSRSRERDGGGSSSRYSSNREDKYYDDHRYKERRDIERDHHHRGGGGVEAGDRRESRRSAEREKDRDRSRH
eukprot:TRINITY_DN2186_c0_g1_i2.p1 TRINITY_DN2186_c0_g1~~TRINITY_DN2186_c0_g1_i2.p1  ORF type:complete len:481 (+),score=200.70 TRINITY_DN2186_c0_g1_i2:28-1470(+)